VIDEITSGYSVWAQPVYVNAADENVTTAGVSEGNSHNSVTTSSGLVLVDGIPLLISRDTGNMGELTADCREVIETVEEEVVDFEDWMVDYEHQSGRSITIHQHTEGSNVEIIFNGTDFTGGVCGLDGSIAGLKFLYDHPEILMSVVDREEDEFQATRVRQSSTTRRGGGTSKGGGNAIAAPQSSASGAGQQGRVVTEETTNNSSNNRASSRSIGGEDRDSVLVGDVEQKGGSLVASVASSGGMDVEMSDDQVVGDLAPGCSIGDANMAQRSQGGVFISSTIGVLSNGGATGSSSSTAVDEEGRAEAQDNDHQVDSGDSEHEEVLSEEEHPLNEDEGEMDDDGEFNGEGIQDDETENNETLDINAEEVDEDPNADSAAAILADDEEAQNRIRKELEYAGSYVEDDNDDDEDNEEDDVDSAGREDAGGDVDDDEAWMNEV
jgi:hypothetical protein